MAKSSSPRNLVQLPFGTTPFTHAGVTIYRGEGFDAFATSLEIAERFGKQHKDVLRAIAQLQDPGIDEFWRRNFAPRERIDERGKVQPYFEVTRDGFSMLAMGFTGTKAKVWKVAYIAAFNAMEAYIRNEILRNGRQAEQRGKLDWQQERATGKVVHRGLTDSIHKMVEGAHTKGESETPEQKFQMSYAKMINKLLGIRAAMKGQTRDGLDARDLTRLQQAEQLASLTIEEDQEQGVHYKAIYKDVEARVRALVPLLPKSRQELLGDGTP